MSENDPIAEPEGDDEVSTTPSEEERMQILMETWEREVSSPEDNKDETKSKKKSKKKKKKDKEKKTKETKDKDKGKEKKKKKKSSKDKDQEIVEGGNKEEVHETSEEKEKSKDKEEEKEKSKTKKKKKGEKKDKDKKKKKKKSSKPSSSSDNAEAPSETTEAGPAASADSEAEPAPVPDSSEPAAVSTMEPAVTPDEEDGGDDTGDDTGDDESLDSDDQRMKALLSNWAADSDDSVSSEEDEDDDDDEDETEADGSDDELGDNMIDHIILACPDVLEAMMTFEQMTGVMPITVGGLAGLGTKGARVRLDNNCYLEIIGPNPKIPGPLGAKLAEMEEGTLVPFHFAIRDSDLSDMKDDFIPNDLGFEPDHIAMHGKNKDGEIRKWEMLFMHGHFFGGVVPYYVNWGECLHPTDGLPEVGPLKSFKVTAPPGGEVLRVLRDVKNITFEEGEPALEFSISTPKGPVTFACENPTGIKFPGYEEMMAFKEAEKKKSETPEE